ncbi:hypothetical protein WJX74_004974 [Apatococcus lobatus]|uniref:Guanylate cyclase domain-containing protein n=1 Tax=Apatococcus lobatus TaxID=904363 RepID=A0AAW1SER2_9CHLO
MPTCLTPLTSLPAALATEGINLQGSLPDVFAALPDLQFLAVNNNIGLVGPLPPFPPELASKMQLAELNNTGLSQCNQLSRWEHPQDCLPNWLEAKPDSRVAPVGHNAMLCPQITFWRQTDTYPIIFPYTYNFNPQGLNAWLGYLTNIFGGSLGLNTLANGVAARFSLLDVPPSLYGFRGCTCLVNYHHILQHNTDGSYSMSCQPDQSMSLTLPITLPLGFCGLLILLSLVAFGCFYRKIFEELEARRCIRLKGRCKPGTLTKSQSRLLSLPPNELTMCMTDVSGSTALWEWNPRVMDAALALQEDCLRSLLPKHSGHEVYTEGDAFVLSFHDPLDGVRFVIELQQELLKLKWSQELLIRPQAEVVSAPGPHGDTVIFAGLRLRAVLHTGWPAKIETHQTTGHINYSGPMVELTEALTSLPSGGPWRSASEAYGEDGKVRGSTDDSEALTFLDMGTWTFQDFLGSELGEDAPGRAALQGIQIMQMLPAGLAARAHHFGRFSGGQGLQESPGEEALTRYQSCIRTSLLLSCGYEAQESHGLFMLAFHESRAAVEWAISCQLCLLRLAANSNDSGLIARMGIAEGPMIKVCPHKATGRADYFGQAVNRAARLRDAALPGQIVLESSMLASLMVQWESGHEPASLVTSCQLAAENFCLLRDHAKVQGDTGREDALQTSVVKVLHKVTSNISVNLPTLQVICSAAPLGTFLLKGIVDKASLCQIVPQELPALLHQRGKRSMAHRMQRGRATCVEHPDPKQQPWTISVHLLDIMSLPMVPAAATGIQSGDPAEGLPDQERPNGIQPRESSYGNNDSPQGMAIQAEANQETLP